MSISLVQIIQAPTTGSNPSFTGTISSSGSGNLLVAAMEFNFNCTVNSISDNKGNTWFQVPGAAIGNGSGGGAAGVCTDIWCAPNCASGTTTITITVNTLSFNNAVIGLLEFSGVKTSSPQIDQGLNLNNSSTSNPCTTPLFSPSQSGELFVSVFRNGDVNTTAINSPWAGFIDSMVNVGVVAYYINPLSGSTQGSFSPSPANNFQASGASFFPAGSPPPIQQATTFLVF